MSTEKNLISQASTGHSRYCKIKKQHTQMIQEEVCWLRIEFVDGIKPKRTKAHLLVVETC
jgi:hypothetical protein